MPPLFIDVITDEMNVVEKLIKCRLQHVGLPFADIAVGIYDDFYAFFLNGYFYVPTSFYGVSVIMDVARL